MAKAGDEQATSKHLIRAGEPILAVARDLVLSVAEEFAKRALFRSGA